MMIDAGTGKTAMPNSYSGASTADPAKAPGHAPHQDHEGAKIGMWLFLLTEITLFGGLFLLFAAYFHKFPVDFHKAGQVLSRVLGAANTVVLISSSLLMALAVGAIQQGRSSRSRWYLMGTIGCALIFLIIKYVEWSTKITHGIYPNGPEYVTFPMGQMMFFNLYYLMTGLHALHIIIGGALIFWVWLRIGKGLVSKDRCVMAENVGLYWHLVDIIWIYLFPLFYLAV